MECQVANAHLKKMSKISSCGYITVQAFFLHPCKSKPEMCFSKSMERGWGREGNEKSFLHWYTQSSAGMISIKGWRGPPHYTWGSHSWQSCTDLEEGRYLESGSWREERRLIYIWDFMHVWIYEEGIQGHYLNHRNLGMRINGYSLPSPSGCCLQMHHWAMRQSIWGYAGRLF